jgi:hypothetical protein
VYEVADLVNCCQLLTEDDPSWSVDVKTTIINDSV